VKDSSGNVVELHCTYDPASRGGNSPDGRRVQGTIHWVSARHALNCEVRLYDRLFSVPDPDEASEGRDLTALLNPTSLVVARGARIEPSVADDPPGTRYQFERAGYFMSDPVDSRHNSLVFNRTVTLRDSWEKIRQGTGDRRREL
jgi:glutaminyl-tRNA synthetase